ncbi:pantoate--beta-alanine ligase [Paenibacillus sp. FSL H8-0034]|uniref:pantoate--beta-alanine ligase n=1 Tax=Paenibacillus sp. FSL H8-0034 TaxID=2954671 RepID=UPI0030F7309B
MKHIHQIQVLRDTISNLRAEKPNIRIGFVPTMGFLHEGHASLLQAARQQCDIVILSIFVNPLQFGPNEDFERYPRDEARDLALAKAAGTDIVFSPSTAEMYPRPSKTQILVSGVTERLCGASRPGHFDGVGIVVTKLFQIIQPDAAFFGMKDAQQVAVIKQLVADLNMPVEIVPCAIIREQDGLAMSSRNVYLQPEEREQALVLSRTLKQVEQQVIEMSGNLPASELQQAIRKQIEEMPLADIDYVEILAYPDLEPIERVKDAKEVIIALAVRFGKTRLIDNVIIQLQE